MNRKHCVLLLTIALTAAVIGCGGSSKPAPIPVANFAGTWVGVLTSLEGDTHSITVNLSQGSSPKLDPAGLAQQVALSAGATFKSTSCASLATGTSVRGSVTGTEFATTLTNNDGSSVQITGGLSPDGTHIVNGGFIFFAGNCLDSIGNQQRGILALTKK